MAPYMSVWPAGLARATAYPVRFTDADIRIKGNFDTEVRTYTLSSKCYDKASSSSTLRSLDVMMVSRISSIRVYLQVLLENPLKRHRIEAASGMTRYRDGWQISSQNTTSHVGELITKKEASESHLDVMVARSPGSIIVQLFMASRHTKSPKKTI